jgi:hypothetical protein
MEPLDGRKPDGRYDGWEGKNEWLIALIVGWMD